MPAKRAPNERLFATTWVHVHEEDSAAGQVYRPEEEDIPLSRRPRKRIRLHPDGSATVALSGADDRYVEQPATWSDGAAGMVIRHGDGKTLQVARQEPSRLLIRGGDA